MSDILGKPAEFIGLVEMQPTRLLSDLKVGDVVMFTHSLPWPWLVRAAAFIRGVSLPPRPPVEYRITDVATGSTGVERVQ